VLRAATEALMSN